MRIYHLGVFVHLEYAREGKLVLIGSQRAYAIAEVFGQHGHNTVYKVYACGAIAGLTVERGIGFHIVCHIGNMDTNFVVAVWQCTH